MKLLGALGLAFLLSACGSNRVGPLLSGTEIKVSPVDSLVAYRVVYAGMVIGAIQLIYDPLAPNWSIDQTRVSEDTFRLDMRMKRYHVGGAGESMLVLKRRARQLQQELGYTDYRLVAYSEGIDSHTPVAQRFAEGTIQLVGLQTPK